MDTPVEMKKSSEIMLREVGDIGWFRAEACLQKIRSTNVEKREILLHASRILKNTCPIVLNHQMVHANQASSGNLLVRQDEHGGFLRVGRNGAADYSFVEEHDSS